jgi:hypothetical protein
MAVAPNTSVKERTGLSARKLKSNMLHPDWLQSIWEEHGIAVVGQTYKDDRYVEIQVWDEQAPLRRRWIITIIDRETGAVVTLRGAGQRETTAEALRQIGALD